jgi:hypothetical protein
VKDFAKFAMATELIADMIPNFNWANPVQEFFTIHKGKILMHGVETGQEVIISIRNEKTTGLLFLH